MGATAQGSKEKSVMASGKRHAEATHKVLLLALLGVAVALLQPPAQWLLVGLIVGHYATPDVRDQHQTRNHTEHLVDRHFGRLVGKLWTIYWWPMARAIPHRHWTSHLPGPATLIAAAWLYAPWLWLLWVYQPTYFDAALTACLWTLPGWFLQDCVHLALDGWKVRW